MVVVVMMMAAAAVAAAAAAAVTMNRGGLRARQRRGLRAVITLSTRVRCCRVLLTALLTTRDSVAQVLSRRLCDTTVPHYRHGSEGIAP